MEIVLATFVGGILTMVTIFLMQRNKERTLELSKGYEIELIKTKARENRLNQKNKAKLVKHNTTPPRSALDLLKDIDVNKIGGIIDMIQGDDYQTDDNPLDTVMDLVNDNPELVKGFVDGIKGKQQKIDEKDKQYNFE